MLEELVFDQPFGILRTKKTLKNKNIMNTYHKVFIKYVITGNS